MNHNNTRGFAYLPAIFIVIALMAAVGVGYVLIKQPFAETKNTNSVTNTTPSNVNTVVNSNTNTTNTNATNINTNTATVTPTALYDAPTGPFTTSGAKVVAFAYAKSTDKLVSRLAKVNAATGKTIETAQLSTIDLQKILNLPIVPNRPSFFRFGSDGDSVLFSLGGSSPFPFIGIYRTSFSQPTKIETIVQYDKDHLFNGDIPTISDLLYNAETNTAVFVIPGDQSGERNHRVEVLNLADKTVRDLATYPTLPQLVGFPSNGTLLEVLYSDKPHNLNGKQQQVKWSYDQIRVVDGSVASTKLLVDEATLPDAVGTPYISLTPDSIAPNNQLVVFTYRQKTNGYGAISFRNIVTGEVTSHVISGFNSGSPYSWSPDSGKILVSVYNKEPFGSVFDLAKGVTASVSGYGQGMLWYPADLIIFSTNSNTLASYNPVTKKRLSIFNESINDNGGYYEGYGGASFSGLRWVNR